MEKKKKNLNFNDIIELGINTIILGPKKAADELYKKMENKPKKEVKMKTNPTPIKKEISRKIETTPNEPIFDDFDDDYDDFSDQERSSNDQRSDVMNPNNDENQMDNDNRSNQMNPNNDAYWSSRGRK
ncbi:MAG: hypothetical protein HeimC3_48280 [Candidatus Heimdallarchaeota archaeon LC_3]|nr:MAG: hypothetical protein HeimC3_48280 [Candidatus Heimdallarchaeota archaeon LC_3]